MSPSVHGSGGKNETWTLPFAAETTVVVNLTARFALVFPARTPSESNSVPFVASNEGIAAIHALVLRGSFSERRFVGKKLSSEARFQLVEPNTANEPVGEQPSNHSPSGGGNPCFRLIYAEHF